MNNFINKIDNEILINQGKIICISINNKDKRYKSVLACLKKKNCYYLGYSRHKLFHEMSVYEELYEILKDKNKTLEYIKVKELSSSRINRSLSKFSGEKWRASFAIADLTEKDIYVYPWMNPDILNMYGELWMNNMNIERCKNGKTVIIPTLIQDCINLYYDVLIDLSHQ